jgi:hypothetical protein
VAAEEVVLLALVAHLVVGDVGAPQQYVLERGKQRAHDLLILVVVVIHAGCWLLLACLLAGLLVLVWPAGAVITGGELAVGKKENRREKQTSFLATCS